ncbi:hypothetical protein [Pantoea sp. SM3]|uniref:hypothetical protein n=1 Tax=Pantoea sp. SM3 TaxID=1628192 RepID=UPI0018CF2792|nr:hypothetical protein [Pantoea sp. SM3]
MQQQKGYGLKRCARFLTTMRLLRIVLAAAKGLWPQTLCPFLTIMWLLRIALAAAKGLWPQALCPFSHNNAASADSHSSSKGAMASNVVPVFQTDARLTHWFLQWQREMGNSYVSAFRSNAWHPSNALAAERLRLEVACPYLTASNKVQEQAGAALGAGISQR